MVKNSVGGNRTKRMARKNMNIQSSDSELRLAVEEGECYAIVRKILGNGMCDVMCNDSKSRLCIIRNKFKGKSKSQNSIEIGKWILVGIRDWEVRSDKTQKCDMLFVYNNDDIDRLKRKNIDFTVLYTVMKDIDKNGIDDTYIMQNDDIEEYDDIENNLSSSNNSLINNSNISQTNNNFSIDDI